MDDEDLFHLALEESPGERSAFLDRACAGDVARRRRLEVLLGSHETRDSFLEGPAVGRRAMADLNPDLTEVFGPGRPDEEITTRSSPAEGPGSHVGPYKLLQQLGEGGMGTVYMAEQAQPVRRKVALKVIKAGMDSRQVVARFEAERQALALMDHVNIARVLDAGATGSGRPYFVMELVHGVPITSYCDVNRLTARQRLELFVPVCRAIQHAHQKGIIHRDIKPSNVLVTLYDGRPVPKVIDFGVAKATEQSLTERTLFTQYGTLVGTLEYMSPEQAEMSALGVDTRSDIFSLGVLLYELLTGGTPLSHKRVREAAYAEVLRMIREEEPQKPSTRLSDSGEALASISAHRHMEPSRLARLMRGELDWIVMKALEKDRNRRYETAGGFAADVQRYLDDEPVQACPPSTWYRFRKFASRNKVALTTGAGVASAVLAALVILAVSNVMIRREQARTRVEKVRAEESQRLAEARADENRRGMEHLQGANALVERARVYTDLKRWDDAHAALTRAIELRPDHTRAWVERGMLYVGLGLWELAAVDLGEALELQEPATGWRWYILALLRANVGDEAGHRELCARMYERFPGAFDRPFTVELSRACVLLPDRSRDPARMVELATTSLTEAPVPPWHLYVLGAAHYRAGQHESAVRRLREALEVDPNWDARPINYPMLAMAYYRLGRHDEARRSLEEAARALDRWTESMYARGQDDWAIHQGATGFCPIFWWDLLECRLYYREARALMGLAPPPDDPRLLVLRARAFAGLRWPDKAIAEYDAALKLSPRDPQIRLEAHRCRGYDHVTRGQWKQAAAEYARATEFQSGEPYLWWYQAITHLAAGDVDAYRRICASMLERFGETQDPRTANAVVTACGLRPDALPVMARLVPVGRVASRWYPGNDGILAIALHRAGSDDEAVRCFDKAAKFHSFRAEEWLFLAMAHHRLGHTGEARRCLARGTEWMREADSRKLTDLAGTHPVWGDWHERVVAPLLLREAETLILRARANPGPNGR